MRAKTWYLVEKITENVILNILAAKHIMITYYMMNFILARPGLGVSEIKNHLNNLSISFSLITWSTSGFGRKSLPSQGRCRKKKRLIIIVVFGMYEEVPVENWERTVCFVCVPRNIWVQNVMVINNPNWMQNERMKKEFRNFGMVRGVNVLIFNSTHTLWSSHRTSYNMHS